MQPIFSRQKRFSSKGNGKLATTARFAIRKRLCRCSIQPLAYYLLLRPEEFLGGVLGLVRKWAFSAHFRSFLIILLAVGEIFSLHIWPSVRFWLFCSLSVIFSFFTFDFPFVFAFFKLCRRNFLSSHLTFRSFLRFSSSVGEIFSLHIWLSVRFCDFQALSVIFSLFTFEFPFVFGFFARYRRFFLSSHLTFRSFLAFLLAVGEIFGYVRIMV